MMHLPYGPAYGMGVYVHWPYCARICPYCDFNVYAAKTRDVRPLLSALTRDLGHHRDAYAAAGAVPEVTSVFFGGGTPSLLSPGQVGALLEAVRAAFPVRADAEVTLEANPLDCLRDDFGEWADAGVTRLSLGLQALDDEALRWLGRDHDGAQARSAVARALGSGLRTSLDLIYALPGQSVKAWRGALKDALALGAGHVSLYELTIAEATPFGRRVRRGTLTPLDDGAQAELYEVTQEETARAGYDAYEISNHARMPDDRSVHNLTYWRSGDWIGIGPGAHGRLSLGQTRVETHAHRRPEEYIAAVEDGGAGWGHSGSLSRMEIAEELILMGLRTQEGLTLARLRALGLRVDPASVLELVGDGVLDAAQAQAGRLVLSAAGRLLADAVAARLELIPETGAQTRGTPE